MVRGGYGPVFRLQAYRFSALEIVDNVIRAESAYQVGPDGGAVTAFYIMKK